MTIRTAAELALERADQMEELAASRPPEPVEPVIKSGEDNARLEWRGALLFAVVTRWVGTQRIEVDERIPRHLWNDERHLSDVARRLCRRLDHRLADPTTRKTIARRARVKDAKAQLKRAARRRIQKKEIPA